MTTPITNAISIFRSQIARCTKANDENFLLELQRLVAIHHGNGHIKRCVFEIVLDANNWATRFKKKEADALVKIRKFRRFLIAHAPWIESEKEHCDIPDAHPTII
jgi:hypothetical protein